jgi:hypothetical protein
MITPKVIFVSIELLKESYYKRMKFKIIPIDLLNLPFRITQQHTTRVLRSEMTVKELLWLIECRIEGEKILPCSYHWSIEMD